MTVSRETLVRRLRNFESGLDSETRWKVFHDEVTMNIIEDFISDVCDCWDFRETKATKKGLLRCCELLADTIEGQEK